MNLKASTACRRWAMKIHLMSWLVLEHFSPSYILPEGSEKEKEGETR
jgi:hypothetical protein